MRTLDEMLQPGKKIKVFYNENNRNNAIWHIRAIVDNKCVVYRVWNGKSWLYHVNSMHTFEFMYEKSRLS